MESSSVKAVVIYHDAPSRDAAAYLCATLRKHAPRQEDLSAFCCRADYLYHPGILQEASTAAAAADLVIFAVPAHALCAPIHRWLWDWSNLRPKGKAGALVVCCDPIADQLTETYELREQLSRVAKNTNVEAFYWVMDSDQPIEPLLPKVETITCGEESGEQTQDDSIQVNAYASFQRSAWCMFL